jgi:hypothetical protein
MSIQRYRYFTVTVYTPLYICTESTWSAVPPVLGYSLPKADVPHPVIPKCLCLTATQSQQHLSQYALTGTLSWSSVQ